MNQFRSLNRDGTFNVIAPQSDDAWFRDFYHAILSLSWPLFFMLAFGFYFGVNLLFGFFYYLCDPSTLEGINRTTSLSHYLDCFFFSVQTFATIGYGRISPVGIMPNILVTVEALAGLLSLSVVTGLLFSRFARPTARILFSNNAVVTEYDGVPNLLLRIANQRGNMISQAHIEATFIVDEVMSNGERYRVFHDLELERHDTPIFALSWTISHEINERSPLRGHTQDSLRGVNGEILITVNGIDDTYSQTINARWSYVADEILWGHRFVDILERDEMTGKAMLHIERFHSTVRATIRAER